jgi:ABC-type multidrug transport system fused ATPase/permease subunit
LKTVWRVFAYLKRYPMLAIATLACAIVGTLMMVVPPAATKYILNDVISGHHPERLFPLLILVAFAMLVQRGLDYLRLLLNNTFEQKVIFDLRRDLYSHIQTLPLRWFDNRPTGDLMTRILEDVSSVERVLIDGIEKGTVAILQIVVVVAGMFYLSTKLALIALAPGAVAGWRRALVYAHGAPAISAAPPRRFRHEFAPARQSRRHSSDQKFCART